jgi:hypothetical protein
VKTSSIFVTACVLFDTSVTYGVALLPALPTMACLITFALLVETPALADTGRIVPHQAQIFRG